MSQHKNDIWFISDTHWQHENILKFCPSRAERWDTVKEMNEAMIDNWNSVVKPQDKVYHLGDVTFGNKDDYVNNIHPRLNGKKRLIVGNHDPIQFIANKGIFQKVMLWRVWSDPEYPFLFTHVPVHNSSIVSRVGCENAINVHGHIHENPSPSEQHFCVCVEQINFTPIHIEDLKAKAIK